MPTPDDEMRRLDTHLKGFPDGDLTLRAVATVLGTTPLRSAGRRPGPPGVTLQVSGTRYLAELDGEPVSVRVVPLHRPDVPEGSAATLLTGVSVFARISSSHVVGIRTGAHTIPGVPDVVCWAEEVVDGTELNDGNPEANPVATADGSRRFLFELGAATAEFHRLGALAFPHIAAIRVRPDGSFVLTTLRLVGRVWAAMGADVPDLGFPGLGSPEDVPGVEQPVPASDVYRLGLNAYLFLARALPVPWDMEADLDGARLFGTLPTRRPTPIRDRRPDLPADLAAVIDRCVAPDPADRYSDADALLAALTR